jgi:hypothetical protein
LSPNIFFAVPKSYHPWNQLFGCIFNIKGNLQIVLPQLRLWNHDERWINTPDCSHSNLHATAPALVSWLLGESLLKCSCLLFFPVVSSFYKESSLAPLRDIVWCIGARSTAPGVSQHPYPLFVTVAWALWCEHLMLVAAFHLCVFTRTLGQAWADTALARAMRPQVLDLFLFFCISASALLPFQFWATQFRSCSAFFHVWPKCNICAFLLCHSS